MGTTPIDTGFEDAGDHTSEARYSEAMSRSRQNHQAAVVGQPAPDPVTGGPATPGHQAPGR